MSTEVQYNDYDEWYTEFVSRVRTKWYMGPLNKEVFEAEYELGMTPEESATEFVNEMNN